MRSTHRLATAFALFTAALGPASGQSVRGVVRDSASGQPIPGAVVWLGDTADTFLARSVSGADGAYSVLRLAGAARLHVLRIGFRPALIRFAIAGSRDTLIDVRLGAIPLMLDPVASSRGRVCPGDKGTSGALQLWEQARAALLATVVSRDADPPQLTLRSYTRSFEPIRHQLVEQEIRGREVVGDHSYVAARPAWALAAEGYLREGRGGDRTFYAPDEDVLLDHTFADTHCLHVVIGEGDHARDVGVGFDPVNEGGRDTLVDVSGILWIDAAKHELRALEFQYTGLERDARGTGGEIEFQTMPNGTPMITRWAIHAAVLAVEAPLSASLGWRKPRERRDRTDVHLVEWREEGGVVVSARWSRGESWRAPLRRISGTLIGQVGRGVPGVRVWLADAPDTVISDSSGIYRIDGVLPGKYLVLASDSGLAGVGLVQGRRAIDVRAGDHLDASMLVVPPRMIVAARCRGQSMPAQTGAVLGRVTDLSGDPVAGASIEATWRRPADAGEARPKPDRVVKSDEEGRFSICGAPIGATVRLHATSESRTADAQPTQQELVTLSLVLRGG